MRQKSSFVKGVNGSAKFWWFGWFVQLKYVILRKFAHEFDWFGNASMTWSKKYHVLKF